MLQEKEKKKQEPKQKNGSKVETQIEKPKNGEKSSIHERYPLNPDYLNQIVVLGKTKPLLFNALFIQYVMQSKKH